MSLAYACSPIQDVTSYTDNVDHLLDLKSVHYSTCKLGFEWKRYLLLDKAWQWTITPLKCNSLCVNKSL